MYCKYIVNSRIYCKNYLVVAIKVSVEMKLEQSHHSLKQVHLHETRGFLCLSFLKQLIKSTVPKTYWTEKIQVGSTLKYGYTQTMVLAKSSR